MSEPRRLDLALQELEGRLAEESLPPGAKHRIAATLRERLETPRAQRGWLPMLSFVGGAALVLLVVALGAWWPSSGGVDDGIAARPTLGAYAVEGDLCRVTDAAEVGDGARWLTGHCRLIGARLTVSTWERTLIEAEGAVLRVQHGRALFDVEKVRPTESSVRVEVSGGTIEVVGTRFEVEQTEGGGHVDLFEGKIRFHAPGAPVVDIEPGSRHRWGDQVPPPAEPSTAVESRSEDADIEILSEERPVRPVAAPRRGAGDAAAIIARVDSLRREGRTAEGVALLRDAVSKRWDRRTAQVLSYELGEFLHRYAADAQAACEHFAAHDKRFGGGRYKVAVARAREQLRCDQ